MVLRRLSVLGVIGCLLLLTACQSTDQSAPANPEEYSKKALEGQKKAFQQQTQGRPQAR
jgi:hypothetical protein